ncbi:expressed unknown protein [Seminavis robusta]|uniref:Uncharacterized protein n=1 Tax=Seminavis robusta TaxID=568900 RepID=A0A9N8HAZ8_9STRA|nr:expressed unknown protein [Seminavis robusta]|eukprot:Sro259_g101470.1 n/a (432) ;mRNA; r:74929-76224
MSDPEQVEIVGSDQVKEEVITEKLNQVKANAQITKVEILDFITSEHHSLDPIIRTLLIDTSQDRTWKAFQFIDSIDVTDYLWWQGLKHMLMRDYEEALPDNCFLQDEEEGPIIQLNVNLTVPTNTTATSLHTVLKTILADNDVFYVQFSLAEEDHEIPQELDRILQKDDSNRSTTAGKACLQEEMEIFVQCGWAQDVSEDWKDVMEKCIQIVAGKQRRAPPRSNTAPAVSRDTMTNAREKSPKGREAPAIMPARRLRRTSTDLCDVETDSNNSLGFNNNNGDDDACELNNSRRRSAPRIPGRNGRLAREAPQRAKSMNVPRSQNAADRLAMLGASGSSMAKTTPPSRTPSGRSTPGRTSSGRVLPSRTSSGRVGVSRSSSGRVSRRVTEEEEEDIEAENEEPRRRAPPPRTSSGRGLPSRTASGRVTRGNN